MSELRLYTQTKCPRCPAAHNICEEFAKLHKLALKVIDIKKDEDAMLDLLMRGIFSTPIVTFGEGIVSIGVIPTLEQLEASLLKEAEKKK